MRTALLAMCLVAFGCGGGTNKPSPSTTSTDAAPPQPPQATPEKAAAAGPWGASVASLETEARVAKLLARVRDGALDSGDLGEVVAFGPGLWSFWQLSGFESSAGIPLMGRVRIGDKAVLTHGRAVRFAALPPFMKHQVVKNTFGFFADGVVGPATEKERQVYYAGIAWPIEGDPVTVVRNDGEVLVVILDKERKLFHVDLLGPWYRLLSGGESEIEQYQPANPFPPVAP